jgi:type IV pilus assembly protein PilN
MIKVNLLKPERKDVSGADLSTTADFSEIREEKVNIPGAIIVAVLIIGVIAFLYITQANELESKIKLASEKKAEETKLKNQLKDEDRLKRLERDLKLRIKTIQELKKKQKQPVYMLLEISKSLPERVWITRMTFNGDKIKISATALSRNLISAFTKNIESSPYFRNLVWGGFRQKTVKGVELFTFNITVNFVLSSIKEGV